MPHDLRTPQQREPRARQRPARPRDRDRHRQPRSSATAASPRSTPAPACRAGAEDCGGDFLAPGLVELHTDNLERHLEPRPGVRWPEAPAILAHDAELAGTGITTVFDALRVGSLVGGGKAGYRRYARPLATEINRLHGAGALRIRHRLHLRAEVCSETLVEELAEFGPEDRVGILSLMDHTPGQRQFTDIAKLRAYATGRRGMNEDEFQAPRRRPAGASAPAIGARHEAAAVAGRPPPRRHARQPRRHHRGRRSPPRPATARASPSSRPRSRPPRACRARGHRGDDGRPEPHPRRLALRQRLRRRPRRGRASSTSSPPTTPRRACSSAPSASGTLAGDMARRHRPRHRRARRAPPASPTAAASRPGLRADLLRFRRRGRPADPARRLGRRRAGRLRPLLSYQHAYHAGGPADLHKHIVLAELLARLTAKPRGIAYVETHAGRGLYDLAAPEALKTGEAAQGIARLAPDPATPFGRALAAVRAEAGPDRLPRLAARRPRAPPPAGPADAHGAAPRRARRPRRGRVPGAAIHRRDGFEGVLALAPFRPRRGLVLVDPSYEVKSDYAAAAAFVRRLVAKWPEAAVLVWYPLLPEARHRELLAALAPLPFLRDEVAFDPRPARGMTGSGLALVNAPHGAGRSFAAAHAQAAAVLVPAPLTNQIVILFVAYAFAAHCRSTLCARQRILVNL